MNYKKFLIILFLFIYSCQAYDIDKQENVLINKKNFINRGFAIVYNDDLYNQKIVSKKIDSRSLIIFQKNLKKGTKVRVKNILNNKTIISIFQPKQKTLKSMKPCCNNCYQKIMSFQKISSMKIYIHHLFGPHTLAVIKLT